MNARESRCFQIVKTMSSAVARACGASFWQTALPQGPSDTVRSSFPPCSPFDWTPDSDKPSKPAAFETSFERFELKYWVPEAIARQIVLFASPYMCCDRHGEPGVGQRNTSLYLDSPDLLFARMHMAQSPNRLKLRVRRYGDPPEGPAFLEIKRKVKWVVLKRRAAVAWESAPELLQGMYTSLPTCATAQERQNLEAFLCLMIVHGAGPKVFIRSNREAYASIDPMQDVRLTLDREILYQPAQKVAFEVSPSGWVPIDRFIEHGENGRRVMVELKFRGMAPMWMSDLVSRFAMWRAGYSKYISAVLREEHDFGGTSGWTSRRM
jgi:hypothetical protein